MVKVDAYNIEMLHPKDEKFWKLILEHVQNSTFVLCAETPEQHKDNTQTFSTEKEAKRASPPRHEDWPAPRRLTFVD